MAFSQLNPAFPLPDINIPPFPTLTVLLPESKFCQCATSLSPPLSFKVNPSYPYIRKFSTPNVGVSTNRSVGTPSSFLLSKNP